MFVNVSGAGTLDFGRQGQRSGGFVQPNLRPSALSRMTGLIAGDVATFAQGDQLDPAKFFHDLSPLLFGCIPLADVILGVTGLAAHPERLPKFVSETTTKVESLFGDLERLQELAAGIGGTVDGLINSLVGAALSGLDDLAAQALVLATAQRTAIRTAAAASRRRCPRPGRRTRPGWPSRRRCPQRRARRRDRRARPAERRDRRRAAARRDPAERAVADGPRHWVRHRRGPDRAADRRRARARQGAGAAGVGPDPDPGSPGRPERRAQAALLAALVKPPPGPLGAFRTAATALHLLDGAPLKAALVVIDAHWPRG